MKQLLFLFSFLFIGVQVTAQEFSIGPKVGVSQANIKVNGDGFQSGGNEFGYHLGLFVRMGGNSIFFQPEFLYTNTGGSVVQTAQGMPDVTFDANFDRFDIPLMFGLKFLKVLRVQAGPVATVLINSAVEDALQVSQDIDFNTTTFGYQAGLGLDVGNLIFDLKYESSLSKISKSSASFQTDQRQNQIILSAGFRLF